MSILRTIKKTFSKDEWKQYKVKYCHKQMRFIVSKIIMIFDNDLDPKVLVHKEKMMLKANLHLEKKMFIHVFSDFNKLLNDKKDWKSFAIFLFYIYQTSTFWKDSKKNKSNIFTNNKIKANEEKRYFYNKWVKTLNFKNKKTNFKLKQVLKLFFK